MPRTSRFGAANVPFARVSANFLDRQAPTWRAQSAISLKSHDLHLGMGPMEDRAMKRATSSWWWRTATMHMPIGIVGQARWSGKDPNGERCTICEAASINDDATRAMPPSDDTLFAANTDRDSVMVLPPLGVSVAFPAEGCNGSQGPCCAHLHK